MNELLTELLNTWAESLFLEKFRYILPYLDELVWSGSSKNKFEVYEDTRCILGGRMLILDEDVTWFYLFRKFKLFSGLQKVGFGWEGYILWLRFV